MLDPLQLVALDSPVNQESRKVVSRSSYNIEQLRQFDHDFAKIDSDSFISIIHFFISFFFLQRFQCNYRIFERERERRERGEKRERIKQHNFCLFQSSDSGGFRERRSSPQAVAMATLSLRISIPEKNATKMMQFDPSTSIYDACRIIREKLAEASNMGQRKLLLHLKSTTFSC